MIRYKGLARLYVILLFGLDLSQFAPQIEELRNLGIGGLKDKFNKLEEIEFLQSLVTINE